MSFAPLRTERLLLRLPRLSDAGALAARRSDPLVAKYQTWTPPYPLERAETMLAELVDTPWLTNDEWSMLTVADPDDTTVLGDLVMHPTWNGRSIEIGYTLARSAWGFGYATEAVDALIDVLWADPKVTRLSAMLHPDNIASEQVLERSGFRLEGETRLSFWVADDNSDDLIYGMTRADRTAWTTRPRHAPSDVRLVDIDAGNVHALRTLATHHSQQRWVPPMAVTLADTLRPPHDDGVSSAPSLFGITADGELVGCVLLTDSGDQTHGSGRRRELRRLLIDARHQRRGIGRRALAAAVADCRSSGVTALHARWAGGRGSPGRFFERSGFVPTDSAAGGDTHGILVVEPA